MWGKRKIRFVLNIVWIFCCILFIVLLISPKIIEEAKRGEDIPQLWVLRTIINVPQEFIKGHTRGYEIQVDIGDTDVPLKSFHREFFHAFNLLSLYVISFEAPCHGCKYLPLDSPDKRRHFFFLCTQHTKPIHKAE